MIPLAIVGIPLDTLITLIVFPVAMLAIGFLIWWFLLVPQPAREYAYAKLFKQDVFFDINDLGGGVAKRGKTEGAGLFRSKNEQVTFLFRNPEPWVNKRFSVDKIGTIFGYTGKAAGVKAETLAVLEANKVLHSEKLGGDKKSMDAAVKTILKGIKDKEQRKQAKALLGGLQGQSLNVEEEEGETKKLVRKTAILLDPRILKSYVSKMISPAQIQYMQKKAYEKGYEDGERPLFMRLIPLLAVIGIIGLIAAMFFMA